VANVICEMHVLDTSHGSWTKPVTATVTTPIKGNTSLDEKIAVRLVEDTNTPFNATLVSFLAGERWLTCARELEDGTLLPLRRHTPIRGAQPLSTSASAQIRNYVADSKLAFQTIFRIGSAVAP